jgi:hypothetical protein
LQSSDEGVSAAVKTPRLTDAAYRGRSWRYGLTVRHIGHHLETSANDWIMQSERPSVDLRFPFGTVDYPRELTEDEVLALAIIPLGQVVTAG